MKPLIQTFGAPMTQVARAMVFLILTGSSILAIDFNYKIQRQSRLTVRLSLPRGAEATFESNDVWDFEVLRHFGMMKYRDRPIIQGYYAFRQA